jgi:type IV pilus assembly protein PilW
LTAFTTKTTGDVGYGSDVLVLRYQTVETFPGSGVTDKTMIDCMGTASTSSASDQDDRRTSVLYVDESLGEPSLMCKTDSNTTPQPVVRGVENFQVLYGVSGVTPNAAPTATFTVIPDRYLRADQMTVAGSTANTNANWARVRSIRIGMVLRGPVGSAQETTSRTLYPFGLAPSAAASAPGSAMSSSDDPGTVFTTPTDSRLRQTVSFTVHLRNAIDH